MIPLSKHGTMEMIIGTLLLVALSMVLAWVWWPLGLLPVPVLVWLFAFFRDPHRVVPGDVGVMVSPADGVVTDIKDVDHDPLLEGPAVRVGIFLSVFNVHVNRAPCDARVVSLHYKKGKFVSALKHDECSNDNESNTILLADPISGQKSCVVKQIAGLIARRIICTPAVGDRTARGERIGLIKFGSRTELTIARNLYPDVLVKVGQKVSGGSDIIARLGGPPNAIAGDAVTSNAAAV
jgi:phosphatidylserine decarboxylase